MHEQIILLLSIGTFIGQQVARTIVIIGASLRDVLHRGGKAEQSSRKPRGKQLSILVLTHNHALTIESCLEAIFQSGLRNIEVRVIDNASADNTVQVVRRYMRTNTKKSVKLLAKRQMLAVDKAYFSVSRYVHGAKVLLVTGADTLSKDVLQAVADEVNAPEVQRLNTQVVAYPSLLGLIDRYSSIANVQLYKFADVYSDLNTWVQSSMVLTKSAYKALAKERMPQFVYAAYRDDLVVHRYPDISLVSHYNTMKQSYAWDMTHTSNSRLGTLLLGGVKTARLLIHFLEPIMLSYFFYLAYSGRNSTLFLLSIAATMLWYGLGVWSEPSLRFVSKTFLTVMSPVFFLLWFVQAVAGLIIIFIEELVTSISVVVARSMRFIRPTTRQTPKIHTTKPWVT